MHSDRRSWRIGTALLLGLAVLHVVLTRLSWAGIPLQTDTGIWAYIGGRLLDGAQLYRDLWEEKPPGIYYTFAAVEWLFGPQSVMALRWLDALISLAVLCITYRLARHFARPAAAAAAVLLLSLVFCHRVLADWGDNVEKFVALFEVSACGVLFGGLRRSEDRWSWLAAGGLCGCAALFKQTGIVFLLAAIGSVGWAALREPLAAASSYRRIGALLVGFAVPWTLVALWMFSTSIAADFWQQVFQYEWQRVGTSERSRLWTVQHWVTVWDNLKLAGILLGPAVIAIFLVRTTRSEKLHDRDEPPDVVSHCQHPGIVLNLLTWYWLGTTLVMIVAPYGYGHYLLQAAPPAAIWTAWLIDRVFWRDLGRSARVIAIGCLLIAMLPLRDHIRFTLDGESRYRQNYAAREENFAKLVDVIKQSTHPRQSVMVWPPYAAASFYANRRTPLECSNFEVIYRGRIDRLSPPMDQLLERLAVQPPDVIVDWSRIKLLSQSHQNQSRAVLLTSREGFSLLEPPNDRHRKLEGRLLAPLKRWVRSHYGGQRKIGPAVFFYRGQPWRKWEDFLLDPP